MSRAVIARYRLAGPNGDGLLPYLNDDGAFLAAGTPLLEKRGDFGSKPRWTVRQRDVLEKLLAIGYGGPVDLETRMGALQAVANALNEGCESRAAIALLHTRLPAADSVESATKMATADGLRKYNPYWEQQGRQGEGAPNAGWWAQSGQLAPAKASVEPVSASGTASAPTAATADDGTALKDKNGNLVIDPNTGKPYPMPPGMNIKENVAQAEYARSLFEQKMNDPASPVPNWEMSRYAWMLFNFRQGGNMDYQRPEGWYAAWRHQIVIMDYRNVTNYNYGAVAAAMGFSLDDALFYAGLHNLSVGNRKNANTSYGNQDVAVKNITQGYKDYLDGVWKNK